MYIRVAKGNEWHYGSGKRRSLCGIFFPKKTIRDIFLMRPDNICMKCAQLLDAGGPCQMDLDLELTHSDILRDLGYSTQKMKCSPKHTEQQPNGLPPLVIDMESDSPKCLPILRVCEERSTLQQSLDNFIVKIGK